MSFTVYFYNYAGNARQIGKTLGTSLASTTIDRNFSDIDSVNPVLRIAYNGTVEGCNMATMGGKTYFITSTAKAAGGQLIVSMHVDVLTTYATGILASPCVCERNSAQSDVYLPDAAAKNYSYHIVDEYTLKDGGYNQFTYNTELLILMTAG